MRRAIMAILMLVCLAVTTGCNTMSGVGKDIEQAGDAIKNAADKNKTY